MTLVFYKLYLNKCILDTKYVLREFAIFVS